MTDRGPTALDCPQIANEDPLPIIQDEMEAAAKALKMGEPAWVNNIPGSYSVTEMTLLALAVQCDLSSASSHTSGYS